MNLKKICDELERAAVADDPESADRVLVAFVSRGSGLYLFRALHGFAHVGGDDADGELVAQLEQALTVLWPDAPPSARRWFTMLAHAAGQGMLKKMLDGFGG